MSRKNPREIDDVIARLLSSEHEKLDSSVSIEEQEEILASDSVRFVAMLHLLATGQGKRGDFIEEPRRTKSKQGVEADVDLPISVWQFVGMRNRDETPATITTSEGFETDTGNPDTARFIRCSVTVDCAKVMELSDVPKLDDPFIRKRALAAGLLETIAASFMADSYTTNRKTLMLERNTERNIVSVFLEYIADGKVTACPVCGRPVLMPRKSSSPFCTKQHQVRYHERAHKMLDGGSSEDDVAKAFPHIKRETITGWQNW